MTEPPASGHLDLDTLADLDEGLVDAAAQPAMRAHLDGCERCHDELARLRTTRALVSTLPAVPMPPEVVQRIDTALTEAAETGPAAIVPIGRKRRWRNAPTLAGAAAAAAVVLLVGALVTGHITRSNGNSAGSATSPFNSGGAAKAPATLKEWQTGSDYTPTTIATLVPHLVTGTPTSNAGGVAGAPGATGSGSSAGGTSTTGSGTAGSGSGSSGSGSQPAPTTPSPATGNLDQSSGKSLNYAAMQTSTAAVLQCATILNGGTAVTPVAVDFARFKSSPAVVFVLPTLGHPESLDVWVVRSVCSTSSFDLYFRRIPRPTG